MSGKKRSEIDAERRRQRQEEQLRENLKRRKDQARARRTGPSPTGEEPDAGAGVPPDADPGEEA